MLPAEVDFTRSNNARLEKNQLIFSEEMSVREWKELGNYLSHLQGNIQFWIGDWVRFGEKKGYCISDVYDELEDITGLERITIQNYKWVAEQTSSLRKEDLSFSHHMAVAKLNESDQAYFLNKASQEKLSVRELRLQIIYELSVPSNGVVKDSRYTNNNPFPLELDESYVYRLPLRLGELHQKLQQDAFAMKTSMHMRALTILREYYDKRDGVIT